MYNLSEIMKQANKLVRSCKSVDLSSALKLVWKKAKQAKREILQNIFIRSQLSFMGRLVSFFASQETATFKNFYCLVY